MYSLAKSLLSYELKDSTGYPFRYQFYDSDELGSCIAAEDLAENNAALHRYLFGNDNYVPSENLKRINESLSSINGVYGTGEKILLHGEEGQSESGSEDSGE